jgi:hypothetical protein
MDRRLRAWFSRSVSRNHDVERSAFERFDPHYFLILIGSLRIIIRAFVRYAHARRTIKLRASLLVRHNYPRIVSPHGSLQLAGINFLAPCPFDKVDRAIRRISAPSLEHTGVDRLVDVSVCHHFLEHVVRGRWGD